MSREIKFRVFDNDTNKMYYTTGLTVCNNSITHVNGHVMQFTGIKDKNGVEVYDGDVIRYTLMEGLGMPERKGLMRIVKTNHLGSIGWYDTDITVLGNRYENPELLTQFELS